MATPATTAVSESHAPHTIDMDGDRRISTAAVFRALLRRDLRVARRELPYFLVRTLMQPLLFIIVFGFLLPKMGFVRGGYTTALLPGIIAISLALSAVQAVALPMVQDFGWTREIEDRLLAPVPTPLIASEKVIAGALQGLMSAWFRSRTGDEVPRSHQSTRVRGGGHAWRNNARRAAHANRRVGERACASRWRLLVLGKAHVHAEGARLAGPVF
jgi:hypothetical protein